MTSRPSSTPNLLRPYLGCLLLAGLVWGPSLAEAADREGRCPLESGTHTLEVDGLTRTYVLEAGPKAQRGPAPLVFLWHGYGGFGPSFVRIVDGDDWPEAIRVAPKGLPRTFPGFGDTPRLGWQVRAGEHDDRDLAFFDALLAKLTATGCVDPARVYSTGFSNGGFFSNLLGCLRSGKLAGIAPVGGGGPFQKVCKAAVPVFMHHGDADRVVPLRMAVEAFETWRLTNQCSAGELDGQGCQAAEGCTAPVRYCVQPGGGHRWPKPTSARIVAFFKRHHRRRTKSPQE